MTGARPTETGPAPRPAATLVILRETRRGPEALLTLRPKSLRFMGGAAVFPGGALAEGDWDPRWERATSPPAPGGSAVVTDAALETRAHLVCALRESYEEVGFLAGEGPLERLSRASSEDARGFLEECLLLGVSLATDRLVSAGRWVTPLGSPVRFDARFFLIRAPSSWEPDPDPTEVDGCLWRTAPAALAELAQGRILMAPPTVEMLQRLAAHASVDEAIEALAAEGVGAGKGSLTARLSPLVQVVVAPNPSLLTGPGTNTYVVGASPFVVIDPAVSDRGYIDAVMSAAGGRIDSLLVTHRHPDHVGGVAELADRSGAPVRAFGIEPAGGRSVVPLEDGVATLTSGACLLALHTPGHAADHLCFLLEGTASLFGGDNVLGEGTPVIAPPEGNMRAYFASLDRLSRIHLERIYTGHFRSLDGGDEVIRSYISHRREREHQILQTLREGDKSVDSIVAEVYTATPSELHALAAHSVLAHLEMLSEEGLVTRNGESWSSEVIE